MVYLHCASTVQLAKYVVQDMLLRNEGRILFTASIAGEMVAPREALYAATATKAFGLFAHSLRYELREHRDLGARSAARTHEHRLLPSRWHG